MLEMLLCEQALYLTKRQKLRLDQFKAFVDDKLNVTKLTMPVYDSRENTVGKGKNAGYQHFLSFFYNPFKGSVFQGCRNSIVNGFLIITCKNCLL